MAGLKANTTPGTKGQNQDFKEGWRTFLAALDCTLGGDHPYHTKPLPPYKWHSGYKGSKVISQHKGAL